MALPLADGLDLGAAQGDPGFEFVQQKVVMAGGAIVRGVPLSGSDRVAGADRFLRTGFFLGNDYVTGLARHNGTSLVLILALTRVSAALQRGFAKMGHAS